MRVEFDEEHQPDATARVILAPGQLVPILTDKRGRVPSAAGFSCRHFTGGPRSRRPTHPLAPSLRGTLCSSAKSPSGPAGAARCRPFYRPKRTRTKWTLSGRIDAKADQGLGIRHGRPDQEGRSRMERTKAGLSNQDS
jgi:hypothetical protein